MFLHRARQELLDLGLRNPLLNYRPLRARGLTITGENPADLHRLLVREAIEMDFIEANPQSAFPNPQSQLDHHLQTPYDSAELQKRLLTTDYIARTYLDDHGVNTLYLALGMVEWRERDTAASPPSPRPAHPHPRPTRPRHGRRTVPPAPHRAGNHPQPLPRHQTAP